jgi:DeoR/GlpR family transcriptional regulator of sugar metabolism
LPPEERRRRIEQLIRETGSLTVAMLEQQFEISAMTARRDLDALERAGKLRRTHGGAILLGFAGHEDSFQKRLDENVPGKQRLARAAVELLEPGETVFLDSSTTAYYAARQILAESLRVTVLTNSVPVMELFMQNDVANVDLVGMGGALRKLTLSFVGPHTVRTISGHLADKLFVSVKGIAPVGYLTDPDPLEVEVKRTMMEHSEVSILLVDGSKFEQRGSNVIAHISEVGLVLAADASENRLEAVAKEGVNIQHV